MAALNFNSEIVGKNNHGFRTSFQKLLLIYLIGRNRFNLYKREHKRTCFTHEIKSISNMKKTLNMWVVLFSQPRMNNEL